MWRKTKCRKVQENSSHLHIGRHYVEGNRRCEMLYEQKLNRYFQMLNANDTFDTRNQTLLFYIV